MRDGLPEKLRFTFLYHWPAGMKKSTAAKLTNKNREVKENGAFGPEFCSKILDNSNEIR
jgi:hypothetical protein